MKIEENNKIRVGFIGLKPDSQWASKSHIPALRFLAHQYEIIGVANSTYESAQLTADALNIQNAFKSPGELVSSPLIDLVVITVKVPYHFQLVTAALEAGKHVYCEHPLGNGLDETRKMAALASKKGVVAVVGTQMVVSPEVAYLRQLINDGYVGTVLSTTLIGSGGSWGGETLANNYYVFDKANGATMLTIPLAHTLAGLTRVLGRIDKLKATMKCNFTEVKLTDTNEIKPKTSEDQIMVVGTLKSGAAMSVHYRGGISRATNLLWEINGTEGDLQITAPLGHSQLAPLTIRGGRRDDKDLKILTLPIELTEAYPENPMVRNIASIYTLLAGDIKNGTRNAPTFDDAVVLQEILDIIETSSGEKEL